MAIPLASANAAPAAGNPALPNASQDEAAAFIARYGKPDIDGTNIDDKTHPTVVSRWLIYKLENVHAFFLPGGVFGARPPYGSWKLLTLQDENTKQTLTREELDERMADRLEKTSAKFPLKP
ncbi:MAG: hypothetical protein ACHQ5A_15505 [Opitutales bacterium]